MNPYTHDNMHRLRFPFPGLEEIKQNYSQAFQDLFVLAALNGKRNGTYLEIGCYDPVILSNTLLLEQWGWTGCAVDHSKEFIDKMAAYPRKCFLSLNDGTTLDYRALLDNNGMPDRIDYASIDIEPNPQTLAALRLALEANRRYSVITFETDIYAGNVLGNSVDVLPQSRAVLMEHGYELIAGNISAFEDDDHPFEDWYFDASYFSADVIAKFKRASDAPVAARKYIYKTGDGE